MSGAWLLVALLVGPADLVLSGGMVYTVDGPRTTAEAVAIKNGRIAFVGSAREAKAWVGPRTEVVSLEGRMLLPGFQDAHVHPLDSGLEASQCTLKDLPVGTAPRDAALVRIRQCQAEMKGDWLIGSGWELPWFSVGQPTRGALDAIVSDRPALFWAADGHSAWVNSKALAALGVDRATPDPVGGRIERDADGAATGLLREAGALIAARVPKPSPEQRIAAVARAAKLLSALGVTAVHEANTDRDGLVAYREAERRGLLSLRVAAAVGFDPAAGTAKVAEIAQWRDEFHTARLHVSGAKIFADGVIESHTALMLAPYADRPGDSGPPPFTPEALTAAVAALDAAGLGIHVHAIGDGAIRGALAAFATVRATGRHAGRFQLAHLEVIEPEDVPRFRELGVIANFQPLWAYADSYVRDLTWPVLGAERSQRLYPIGDVVRSGATVAFGSDWSVSSPNPLLGIKVALTRLAPEPVPDAPLQPLLPEQAITLPEALAAYTIGSAYANGLERETGSIEVGKAADLVMLSDDLFALPAARFSDVRVLMTLVDGQPVYRDPSLK
jgi:predicted amidohydrolase YtcJ